MVKKVFSARFENLAQIRKFVVHAAQEAGFHEKDVYAVELAVDEACTNIIEHAYGGEGRGDIECVCEIIEGELMITLKDRGKAFEPHGIPEPDFSVGIENLRPRGAGLYIMRKMMDEIEFSTDEQGRNVLKMTKKSKRYEPPINLCT